MLHTETKMTTNHSLYDMDDIPEDTAYIYKGSEAHPIYTTQHAIPRSDERTIRHDLKKLGLPNNIVNIADSIFQNNDFGTKRGRSRKMLYFYCSFTAYNKEGIPVDPNNLATICGLARSDISKALSMGSHNNNINNAIVKYTPKNYIPLHFKKLKDIIKFPDGAIEEIYGITDEVMNLKPSLDDENPLTVAAAIMVFYLEIFCNFTIDKKKYKSIFGRSDITVNKIKKIINNVYNE